jgi:hypothetical protein
MPRHVYSKLDEAAYQILLVTIFSSVDDAELASDLHTVRFHSDEPVPHFEALSYTWGSSEGTTEIRIDHSLTRKLLDTRNLDIPLRHLRYADRPRTMWIDAICVDQENLNERGQQVQRMPDIYSKSEHVIV